METAADFFLAKGFVKGDRILVILPNSIEVLVVKYSCSKSGVIPCLLNPAATEQEIATALKSVSIFKSRKVGASPRPEETGNENTEETTTNSPSDSIVSICIGETKGRASVERVPSQRCSRKSPGCDGGRRIGSKDRQCKSHGGLSSVRCLDDVVHFSEFENRG